MDILNTNVIEPYLFSYFSPPSNVINNHGKSTVAVGVGLIYQEPLEILAVSGGKPG